MICPYCKREFTPSKYKPAQKICSSASCQRKRQIENLRIWRKENPGYFKDAENQRPILKEIRRQSQRRWMQKHKKHLKWYRALHREDFRKYMKEYMKKYRKQKEREEAK